MLQRFIGYTLCCIGFIGYGYFNHYKGSLIPYSTFWVIVSIIIGLIGVYIAYRKPQTLKQERINEELLERLKQNGEKIIMDKDTCEIRENNYYEEEINEDMSRSQAFDALYDPNRNYKQNYIEQSAIIYYYNSGGKKYRMTSQSFPFNAEQLSHYVWERAVILYVNRANKAEYAFELKN